MSLVEPSPRLSSFGRAVLAIDVASWGAIIVAGAVVCAGTSPAVTAVIGRNEPLVIGFAILWLAGGIYGFGIRAAQLGILEVPAIAATITALLSYEAILWGFSTQGHPAPMSQTLAALAILNLLRRWIILAALGTSVPRHPSLLARTVARLRHRR